MELFLVFFRFIIFRVIPPFFFVLVFVFVFFWDIWYIGNMEKIDEKKIKELAQKYGLKLLLLFCFIFIGIS
jgi:hypothetical protein